MTSRTDSSALAEQGLDLRIEHLVRLGPDDALGLDRIGRGPTHEEGGRAVHAQLDAGGHVAIDVALVPVAAVDALIELGRVEAQVLVTGAQGLIPERAEPYTVRMEWRLVGGDWKLGDLRWEE